MLNCHVEASTTLVYTVSAFHLGEFNVGKSLAFQSNYILKIEVIEGILNGSNAFLKVYHRQGQLIFLASNDSKIKVNSNSEYGLDIGVWGASLQNMGNFTYLVTIQKDSNVKIQWDWYLESWVDKYTVLGFGLGGIGLMVASPSWVALGIRKKGFNEESIERMAYGFVMFIIGFGLFLTWLSW